MATIKITLYKRKSRKIHPISVRVTEGRLPKYISLGCFAHENEWNDQISRIEVKKGSKNDKAKDINLDLNAKENKIDKYLSDLKKNEEEFNFNEFKLFINGKKSSKIYLFEYFDSVIAALEKAESFGNANLYKTVKNSILRFRGASDDDIKELSRKIKEGEPVTYTKNIKLAKIDLNFIKEYSDYMLGGTMNGNGAFAYMRTFRALINLAITDKIIKKEKYPFDGYVVSKLKRATKKRSLSQDHLELIRNHHPDKGSFKYDAKLIFMFMYFCRGMNIYDISFLKHSQIYNNRIYYVRNKLKNRTDNEINISVRPEVQKIIDYFKTKESPYVFPIILNDDIHVSIKQKRTRVATFTKKINKAFNSICDDLEIENINLTTYVARHTYATTLKRKGVETSLIQKGLGHESEKTTQIYLDSFENDYLDEIEKSAL